MNLNNEFIRQEIQGFSEQVFAFGAEGKGGPPPLARRKSEKMSEKLEDQTNKLIIQVMSEGGVLCTSTSKAG